MSKKSGSGCGINKPNQISESLETIFWVRKYFFDADPGWKKFGSGIRNKHPGFATLPLRLLFVLVDSIGTGPVFEPDPDLLCFFLSEPRY
jgi:hypothetical protein